MTTWLDSWAADSRLVPTGDFPAAVKTAKRAIRLAGKRRASPQLLAVMRASLAHYRDGHPMRVE